MASYNGKDIDRVSRLGGMSRARAEALLQQYDGHADRVLEEKCGAVRVYVEPECVEAQENVLQSAWRGVSDFAVGAWEKIASLGKKAAPILPVLLIALASAPAGIVLFLAALFMRMSI